MNEWYEINDGWFTYYANKSTGKKKFELEDGDILVERELDDFAELEEKTMTNEYLEELPEPPKGE